MSREPFHQTTEPLQKDLYPEKDLQALLKVLAQRLGDLISPNLVVTTAADPRAVEYVIEQPGGSHRAEWRKPAPEVAELKSLILKTLDKEGLG